MLKSSWIRPAITLASFCFAGAVIGAPADNDATAARQKQAEAKAQIYKLQDQLKQLRNDLAQSPDLAAERKAMDDAKKVEFHIKGDPSVTAAKKSEDEAWANLKKLQEAETNANPEVVAAQKEDAAAGDALKNLTAQEQAAKAALDNAKQLAARNPKLLKLQGAVEIAELQLHRAPNTSDSIFQAQKNADAARKNLEQKTVAINKEMLQKIAALKKESDEKVKALPEYKLAQEAEQSYDDALKNSKEIVDAKAARDAAQKAYQDELKNTASDPDVVAQQKKRDEIESKIKDLTAAANAAHKKVEQARMAAVKNNSKVAEAQKAAEQASLTEKKTYEEVRDAHRAAVDKASKELAAKIESKLAADPKAVAIKKQLDDLGADAKPGTRAAGTTTKPAGTASPTTKPVSTVAPIKPVPAVAPTTKPAPKSAK